MTTVKQTYTAEPANGKALTVGELRQWLASIDGCPDDTTIVARVNFGGTLRKVSVTQER